MTLNLYAQTNVRSNNARISLEEGGIDNQGRLATNKTRVRTKLLKGKACLKVGDGFSIMNCAQYDSDGSFVGFAELYYMNGFYYWDSPYQVRVSFYKTNQANIQLTESIVETYYDEYDDIINAIEPQNLPPYLDVHWRTVIDNPKESLNLRLPIIEVFKNGDIFVCCEIQDSSGKNLGCIQALSKDKGQTFVTSYSPIPLQEICYDKRHDVVFSINPKGIFRSSNHGKTWEKTADLNIVLPEIYHSYTLSPVAGLQLSNGVLVVPMRAIKWAVGDNNHKIISEESNFLLYSSNWGKKWQQSPYTPFNVLCDESVILENKKNRIILNARGGTEWYIEKSTKGRRVFETVLGNNKSRKEWSVKSWDVDSISDGYLWDCMCHASMAFSRRNNIFFYCSPFLPGEYTPRRHLHLSVSHDSHTWKPVCIITPYGTIIHGYSSMKVFKDYLYIVCESKSGIDFSIIHIPTLKKTYNL